MRGVESKEKWIITFPRCALPTTDAMILKYLWQKIDEKLAKILAFFIYNTLSL
jgi:hypothetical protein